jgi:2-amino-4-hydroxy-6-hydroxymethyldihydropteridine diphosphokinase
LKAGIALGSNLGNRELHLRRGLAFLQGLSSSGYFAQSSVLETEPVGCPAGSGAFLNAAAEIEYAGTPRQLFDQLKAFERAEGRAAATILNAPRPLDLDLLYFGDEVVNEGDLVVPHPRMTQRRFVLGPLAEIVPGLVLPGQTRTVRELAETLP